MKRSGISLIMQKIKENSNDKAVRDFLMEIVSEEVENRWQWREIYKKKIEKYSKESRYDANRKDNTEKLPSV